MIHAPSGVESVRARLRDEAKKSNTWGHVSVAGEGWVSQAEGHRVNV